MSTINVGPDTFVLKGAEYRRLLVAEARVERLSEILRAADHTLSVHGKIDGDTPLHKRIAGAYGEPTTGGK